jgi:hypothetical protein
MTMPKIKSRFKILPSWKTRKIKKIVIAVAVKKPRRELPQTIAAVKKTAGKNSRKNGK